MDMRADVWVSQMEMRQQSNGGTGDCLAEEVRRLFFPVIEVRIMVNIEWKLDPDIILVPTLRPLAAS